MRNPSPDDELLEGGGSRSGEKMKSQNRTTTNYVSVDAEVVFQQDSARGQRGKVTTSTELSSFRIFDLTSWRSKSNKGATSTGAASSSELIVLERYIELNFVGSSASSSGSHSSSCEDGEGAAGRSTLPAGEELESLAVGPAQFFLLSVPQISWLEAHPFTVSRFSRLSCSGSQRRWEFSLVIKVIEQSPDKRAHLREDPSPSSFSWTGRLFSLFSDVAREAEVRAPAEDRTSSSREKLTNFRGKIFLNLEGPYGGLPSILREQLLTSCNVIETGSCSRACPTLCSRNTYDDYDHVLFVAGGIGITAIKSVASWLLARIAPSASPTTDAEDGHCQLSLVWVTKTVKLAHAMCRSRRDAVEIAVMQNHFTSTGERSLAPSERGGIPQTSSSLEALRILHFLKTELFCTSLSRSRVEDLGDKDLVDAKYTPGRPDMRKIMMQCSCPAGTQPDAGRAESTKTSARALASATRKKILVFVCGPASLVKAVRKEASAASLESGLLFDVWAEKYEL
ncbi:unnamed protein product [Amoebophrya sp. A25]|nr:unnamed protein product [Amoebophrya sp. A25]|eukprot:GSA25T00020460001.1